MKKLFSLLVLIVTLALSQARIGHHESEIRKEFKEYKIKKDYFMFEGQKINYLGFEEDRYAIMYLLDDEGYSKINIIIPKTQGYLNYLVEQYNKNYVIVSNQEWKWYSKNGVVTIKLIFNGDYTSFWFIQEN